MRYLFVLAFVFEHVGIQSVYLTDNQRPWWPLLCMFVVNGLLAQFDIKSIQHTGNAINRSILIPVYLWQRSDTLLMNQAPFIVWIAPVSSSHWE